MRRLHSFALTVALGLLLSTSATRESHEWDGFQAGVFSHEVRSGLYGAADVDGDGQISYREIAAFVVRANVAIANERLRPDVYARPPEKTTRLLDLRPGLARGPVIDGELARGHYLIEDRTGNRLLDFHNAPGRELRLVRLGPNSVFLRHVDSGREYEITGDARRVQTRDLVVMSSPVRARGAAHLAFSLIFSLPFDEQAVNEYQLARADQAAGEADAEFVATPTAEPGWRKPAAITAFAAAALASLGAGAAVLASRSAAAEAARQPQIEVPARNRQIEGRRRLAIWLSAASAAAAGAGLLFSLWPASAVTPGFDGAPTVGVAGRF